MGLNDNQAEVQSKQLLADGWAQKVQLSREGTRLKGLFTSYSPHTRFPLQAMTCANNALHERPCIQPKTAILWDPASTSIAKSPFKKHKPAALVGWKTLMSLRDTGVAPVTATVVSAPRKPASRRGTEETLFMGLAMCCNLGARTNPLLS